MTVTALISARTRKGPVSISAVDDASFNISTPLHSIPCKYQCGGQEAAEAKESKLKTTVGGDESTKKGTGSRNLFLQFTCNQCEGVSQFLINKNAYTDGIVICTCQTCQVKHLLADNLKKVSAACVRRQAGMRLTARRKN